MAKDSRMTRRSASIDNVVRNWLALAEYDMKTAQAMFECKRYLYVLFMLQQAIEKVLKGIYVRKRKRTPPYTHNVLKLISEVELTNKLTDKQKEILAELNSYYIETRYTEDIIQLSSQLKRSKIKRLLSDTKDVYQWLRNQVQL